METKLEDLVSKVKNKIIEESILSLQSEGLRFSIDTLAQRLKISKKTIYKYFANKEELAVSIYKKFYADCKTKLVALLNSNVAEKYFELLSIYYQSFNMNRGELFNKYALNDKVRQYAEQQHKAIWEIIADALTIDDKITANIIIDGTFEKLFNFTDYQEKIIHKLVTTLC